MNWTKRSDRAERGSYTNTYFLDVPGHTVEVGGKTSSLRISRWYDVYTRLWTIYLVSEDDYQVGPAQYGSDKADADDVARMILNDPKFFLYSYL